MEASKGSLLYWSNVMDRIELEESSGLVPVADLRPRMDEPPPVALVAVEDVHRETPPGLTDALDRFYVDLLEFLPEAPLVYRAENFRLHFAVVTDQKPLERESVRPQGIVLRSLRDAEKRLAEAEIDYLRQRGLLPGQYTLLCQDPAGNWIELFESIPIM
jgi:hypothetical protein